MRGVPAAHSDHIWGIDITYIRLKGGWLYLVAVMDWFSRYVISWELSQTLEMPFVVVAVERALAQATPLIWNSDQGSHFTSPQYTELLLAAGVQTPALRRAQRGARCSRACYALWTIKVMKRCAINMAKATKCSPASVSAKRS